MILPPDEIVRLVDPYEFDRQFFKLLRHHTQQEAYQLLEGAYQAVFKRRRYASFDSYRISKYKRHLK